MIITQLAEASRDHFVDTSKVINALHVLNTVSSISGLEGQSINKLHQTGDRFVAPQVCNIDAFDHSRRRLQFQDLLQTVDALFGIDVEDLGLHMCV